MVSDTVAAADDAPEVQSNAWHGTGGCAAQQAQEQPESSEKRQEQSDEQVQMQQPQQEQEDQGQQQESEQPEQPKQPKQQPQPKQDIVGLPLKRQQQEVPVPAEQVVRLELEEHTGACARVSGDACLAPKAGVSAAARDGAVAEASTAEWPTCKLVFRGNVCGVLDRVLYQVSACTHVCSQNGRRVCMGAVCSVCAHAVRSTCAKS